MSFCWFCTMLQPLLVISSHNIIRFSQISIGLKNMNVMISNANAELAMTLVSKLKLFLLDIATHKKGKFHVLLLVLVETRTNTLFFFVLLMFIALI